MLNKKQLQAEINTMTDLKTIIEAYEEIAAMRMRKVKKSVLQSREFLGGLNDIYQRVIYTYRLYSKSKHRSKNKAALHETNGKTVSVLISSNTGLYGDIVKRTYELFIQNIVNNSHDVVIIGRTGKQMYDNFSGKRTYKFFDAEDSAATGEKIKEMLDYLLSYTNIVVYHGIFISMLSQKPVATFVTGKALDLESSTKVQELKCIVEPSIDEVAKFFEKQILSSIFEQSLYESSLSKYASRMVSLDYANENINTSLAKVSFAKLKIRHMNENSDQLERMSGISLWK